MNADQDGYAVDLDELEALARTAAELSDNIGSAWEKDWFEDGNWPVTDPLRIAVITYRRSLQAAMERLCGGTQQLSSNLREIAARYAADDADLAARIRRIADDA